ncbi:sigma-70 family RNA polymerase sigma factor [Echinicola sediminis]
MTELTPILKLKEPDSFASHKAPDFPGDKEVWNLFRNGCESSFIRIYETYVAELYDYGAKFCKDSELVKDAVQDLFIEIRTNRKNLGNTGSIKFYLYKALRRKIIRENKKWLHKILPLDHHSDFELEFSHEHLLINKQIKEEQTQQLNKALEQLTARQKEMIYYYFFEDMEYEQIKELMHFSNIKATRNLLYRTIDHLKSALAEN